jgi:uncharacterized protein YodC (DUF2158 family)
MSNAFQVGDVVTLKSGGVRMTVEKIEEDGVSCIWQEANKTQRETFAAAVLEKYTPTTAGAVDLLRQP